MEHILKHGVFIIFLLYAAQSFAQFGEGNPETIESWKQKTLIVIQYPHSDQYNKAVASVAKKRWYNTQIEFVEHSDRLKLKKRKDIVVLNIRYFIFGSSVICLSTTDGDEFKYSKKGSAFTPIQSNFHPVWDQKQFVNDFESDKNKQVESYDIAFGLQILKNSTLQRTMLMIELLFNTTDKFLLGEYRFKNAGAHNDQFETAENINTIKTKTLLMEQTGLPTNTKNKNLTDITYLKYIYKGEIQIVDKIDLSKAIAEKAGNKLYFHMYAEPSSAPAFSVVDIATTKIIYTGRQKVGDAKGDGPPIRIDDTVNKTRTMLQRFSKSVFGKK